MNVPPKLIWICVLSVWILYSSNLEAEGKTNTTISGYVLDSACAFVKNLKKPVSTSCATSCAKAGSPLVILTDDGKLYWPISDSMPAAGQNERLLKFAGQRIAVDGTTYEKGGSHAIVIEKIQTAAAAK